MHKKHLIAYPATALIALGIGASGGGDSTGSAAAGPTVTTTVAGESTSEPAVTVTATPTVKVTETAPAPEAQTAMSGDGTYEVGVDVQPGTYVSAPTSGINCYWERSTGSDDLGSIIDNDNTTGQAVVTIKKSDKFFTSSGCSDWKRR